jgi:hypothetical protein
VTGWSCEDWRAEDLPVVEVICQHYSAHGIAVLEPFMVRVGHLLSEYDAMLVFDDPYSQHRLIEALEEEVGVGLSEGGYRALLDCGRRGPRVADLLKVFRARKRGGRRAAR